MSNLGSVAKSVWSRLSQRRKATDPLWAVEESGRPRDHEVEAGKPAAVHLVDQLTQRVQRPIAHIAPHALERLDLIQNEDQPGTTGIPEHGQQPCQEAERGVVVDLPFHAGDPLDGSGDVRLTPEPRQKALGLRVITVRDGLAVGAKHRRERRRAAGDVFEAPLGQRIGRLQKSRFIRLADLTGGEHLLLEGEEPAIDHRAKRTPAGLGRGQPLHQSPVYGLQVMERRLPLRDLHLARCEPSLAGVLRQPPAGERLARSVLAPDRLEPRAASLDDIEFVVEGGGEAIEADGESIEASLRHRSSPECVDDLAASLRGDHSSTWNWVASRSRLRRAVPSASIVTTG